MIIFAIYFIYVQLHYGLDNFRALSPVVTIGTFDGSNIEIAEEAGKENIFLFGLKANQVDELRSRPYDPRYYINNSQALSAIFHLIQSNFLSPVEFGLFEPIVRSLYDSDYFLVCADFADYCNMQDKVSKAYRDREEWAKRSIINVARSGKFSSDRAIEEYAKDIWHVPCHQR